MRAKVQNQNPPALEFGCSRIAALRGFVEKWSILRGERGGSSSAIGAGRGCFRSEERSSLAAVGVVGVVVRCGGGFVTVLEV
jgi:hypothetical protein